MTPIAAWHPFGHEVDWGNAPTWVAAGAAMLTVLVGGGRYFWNKREEKRQQANQVVFSSYLVPEEGASSLDPVGWAESASQEILILNGSDYFISELSILIRTSALRNDEDVQELLEEEHGEWIAVEAAFLHRYGPQDYHLDAPRTWPSRLAPTERVVLQIAQTVTLLPGDTELRFKDRRGQRWSRIDDASPKREKVEHRKDA